jgi:hypothetical protein
MRPHTACLMLLLAVATGCGDAAPVEPTGPQSGVVSLVFSTPSSQDAAAVLTVTTAATAFTPAQALLVFADSSAGTWRFVVVAKDTFSQGENVVGSLHVRDVVAARNTTVSVSEVAAANFELAPNLAGYSGRLR